MRLARAYSIDDVRIEESAVPPIGPDEALLKVEACGLCSSDCLDWYVLQKSPIVLGHEPTGVLVRVGRNVEGFSEGMRVFTHHHVPCGQCAACRRGADSSCRLFRESSLDPGGFAEYLRIPAENLRRDTQPLPDSMDWETGTWIEPLACSLRVFDRCPPVRSETTVLVVGLGAMGLLNGLLGRALGAGRIIGSDPVPVRRALALELGFDAAIVPARDPRPQVLDLTDGLGADVVIVGPGSREAIEQGISCAAPRGTVVLFTPTVPGTRVSFDANPLYFGELSITASYSCNPDQTRRARILLESGRIDPRPLVTFRSGLEGVAQAIRRTLAKDRDLKAIIFPGLQDGKARPGSEATGRDELRSARGGVWGEAPPGLPAGQAR